GGGAADGGADGRAGGRGGERSAGHGAGLAAARAEGRAGALGGAPAEARPSGRTGDRFDGRTRLVVVRTGPSSAVAVEARGAYGNDAGSCAEGVLVYRVRTDTASGDGPVQVLDGHPGTEACPYTSVYPPLADAPLGVGDTLTSPADGVRVTVTGRARGGDWRVRVTRGVR
ncbi:peptidase M6, partial [Streptomyces sp. B1866]|nr:peptidase M6 [Streptomyces sp. B1866]